MILFQIKYRNKINFIKTKKDKELSVKNFLKIESHTELIHKDPLSDSREIEIDIIFDSIIFHK